MPEYLIRTGLHNALLNFRLSQQQLGEISVDFGQVLTEGDPVASLLFNLLVHLVLEV